MCHYVATAAKPQIVRNDSPIRAARSKSERVCPYSLVWVLHIRRTAARLARLNRSTCWAWREKWGSRASQYAETDFSTVAISPERTAAQDRGAIASLVGNESDGPVWLVCGVTSRRNNGQ